MKKVIPSREELYQLYIIENKSRTEMLQIYNISTTTFKRWMKLYNIKKPKSLVYENISLTVENKYHVKNYRSSSEFKLHMKDLYKNKTLNEKNEINRKREQTNLKKYGVTNNSKLEENKEKVKNTNKIKFGGIGYASSILREKSKKTLMKRYNVNNPSQSEILQNKKYNTQRKNKTFGTSKVENYIFDKLNSIFKNVERQYRSEEYPFACDFYIPSLRLYIEYQGTWTHGNYSKTKSLGAYDETNINHLNLVKKWKEKAKEGHYAYDSAIRTWTIRDPLKRETAKKNGLNWIEFFNLQQFNTWFDNISETLK